jgi:hypothetical protein
MKLFNKIFKKKKVEVPALTECMDAMDQLKDCLKRSRDIEDYDDLVDANLIILSAKIDAWQKVAQLHLIRFKFYEVESQYGKIKIRED